MILWLGHSIPMLEGKKKPNPTNQTPGWSKHFTVSTIMKASMSILLIASSEPFPDHTNSTSCYNTHLMSQLY